jgi:hypothetical protein
VNSSSSSVKGSGTLLAATVMVPFTPPNATQAPLLSDKLVGPHAVGQPAVFKVTDIKTLRLVMDDSDFDSALERLTGKTPEQWKQTWLERIRSLDASGGASGPQPPLAPQP